jgi:GTP cyclohydrolase I
MITQAPPAARGVNGRSYPQAYDDIVGHYRAVVQGIGEDVNREGLLKTPARAAKAMLELTVGYDQDPAAILGTIFNESCDEMVVVANIPFYSLCEHHLLPFFGSATIGYIPDGRIVGLSKIPRLVHCFAKRLQVQERLTRQIVDAIQEVVRPRGAACVINGHHLCMSMRGVGSSGSMHTCALKGLMLENPSARDEFLRLGIPKLPSFS